MDEVDATEAYPAPKHPQHPQHPRPAANENSSRVNLQDQADPSRLYKQAHQAGSRNLQNDLVETTSPDHLPPSAPSGLVETTSPGRPHTPELAKALTPSSHFSHRPIEVVLRAGSQGGAISLPRSGCHLVSHHPQTPPRAPILTQS